MAKRSMTRRAKMLKRQSEQQKAGHHQAIRKHNPDAAVTAPGKGKTKPGTGTGDKSDRARASTSIRGRTTHSLSSAGRKTTARTQGGAARGSGRGHDY